MKLGQKPSSLTSHIEALTLTAAPQGQKESRLMDVTVCQTAGCSLSVLLTFSQKLSQKVVIITTVQHIRRQRDDVHHVCVVTSWLAGC